MSDRRQTEQSDIVKLAVREALNDKRMEDLALQNQDILTKMAEGFTRVTTRQDIANGKLMAHQARFDQMDGEKRGMGGYEKLVWLALTTLISLVVYFIR